MPPVTPAPDDLFEAFFDLSLTGGICFAPVLDAAGTVADFAYVRLNPAAQRMLALPEQPAETYLTRYPHALQTGVFAFYREAYESGAARRGAFNYQYDGLDNYFHLAARRVGGQLLVSFTDTSDQPRTAAEQALRESQAREQAARAEVEARRGELQRLFEQAPVPMALFRGPAYVVELVNEPMAAVWGQALEQVLGRPVFEALPYVRSQGFEAIFADVLAQGTPYDLHDVPVTIGQAPASRQAYFHLTYRPQRDAQGCIMGIITSAHEVTEQVEARRRVEQLNQELEARVAERTRQLEAARAHTERQRRQWEELFRRAPAAICIFDGPAWVHEFVNPGYQALFPGRKLLGLPLLEALPELAGQPLLAVLHRVYDTGEPFEDSEVLVPLARTEGGPVEDIYFDFTYQARYNEAGQIDGFVTYAYDVTEQVLARRAREVSQGELQRIFEQAPTIISVLRGPRYVVELANDQQVASWGRPRAQVLGRPLFEALPELAAQGFEQLLRQVLTTGQPYAATDAPTQLGPPGESREAFLSLVVTPLSEADGRVSGVIVVATDTTTQVLARRQADTLQAALLAAAQRQVQQREELYQIFEQAPAAIVLLREPDHRIEYVNPAYQQLFPELVLRGRLLVDAQPSVVASGALARLDRVYQTGEPYVGEEQPVELTRAPGQPPQTHYFNFTYQPYREAGRTVGVSIFAYDVTGPALARRRAAEQDRQFRELYEQAPMAVTILRGPEFVVELANPAILRIWGQTAEAVLGRPRLELIPETSRQRLRAVLETAYRTRQTHHVQELPVVLGRSHTGQPDLGYFNFSYQPLLNEQGEPLALTCVGIEVTEQVRARQQVEQLNQELETRVRERTREAQAAQAAAERERALLQALLAQAPVAIGLFQGQELRVTTANEMMAAIWGYTPAQVLGKPLLEGVPELRGQGFDEMLRQVMATGVPITGTETPAVMRRDGTLKTTYYNFVYQPLYNAEGEVLGAIDVAVEVTEQIESRRALERLNQELEARVAERTHALSEQQVLLRQILGNVPAYIATLSGPEHRYTFFNELYQTLSAGRTALGLPVAEVFPEVVAQGFIGLLDQVYLTGEPFIGAGQPVLLYDAQLGRNRQHYVDFVYQPLFDGQQRVQGILAFILDVTDRVLARQLADKSKLEVQVLNEELATINEELRATNEEMQHTNAQLLHTNADLDTFVYTASHDLKAPITNIEGLVLALRQELPPAALAEPVIPHLLELMEKSVGRFLQTISQLTDVSRLQQAAQEPAEAVALATLLEDIRLDLAPLFERTHAQLLHDLDACPTVLFPPKNLRSIFYNLLSNALKYRDPQRSPVVRVRASRTGQHVVLEVQDNGLGLSEAQQNNLFVLFKRLHTHVEGSGVGLYMLKRIVENARGTIAVRSEPGVGSTFTVTLPRLWPVT